MKDKSYPCAICGKQHGQQAFISHASKDEEIARHVSAACCNAGAAPYLYELEANRASDPKRTPADQIALAVGESQILFAMLGPNVSAYWTQAWIGYEIGVLRGRDWATQKLEDFGEYFSHRVIVLEDIRQGTEVSVPYLHAMFLFDFQSIKRWEDFEDAVRFFADTAPQTPDHSNLEFFKAGNRLRGKLLFQGQVECRNSKCHSRYDVGIFREDIGELEPTQWIDANTASARIRCPSCDKDVDVTLSSPLYG